MRKSTQPPDAFFRFTDQMHQDFGMYASQEDLVHSGLQGLAKGEMREFAEFLRRVLTDGTSNATLRELWKNTDADFYLNGATVRQFFVTALNLIEEEGYTGALYKRQPRRKRSW